MTPIRLKCACCQLERGAYVRRGRARYTVYRYNGSDYVGFEALGAELGASADRVRQRVGARLCLRATTEELMARRDEALFVTDGSLAVQFQRVMAAAFGG